MARVHNGLLSNQPSQKTDLTLADITDLLGAGQTRTDRAIVQRSNSSPIIEGERVGVTSLGPVDILGCTHVAKLCSGLAPACV